MGGPAGVSQSPLLYTPNPNQSVMPKKGTAVQSAPQGQNSCQPEELVCKAPATKTENKTANYAQHNGDANACTFENPTGKTEGKGKTEEHGKTEGHGGGEGHEKTSFGAHVAKDVGINTAHHVCEHAIEHAAEHAAEHALEHGAEHAISHAAVRAAEHGVGEAVAHGATHIGGRLAAVAAPGVGAVAAGYLAYKGVEHAVEAGKKGHVGASLAFALAATVDGTTAVVNGAGAVSGAGVVISTPVSIGLGVVATGLSALGAWLDD